jgi:hypothetical protein
MAQYLVCYEARNAGAIGAFTAYRVLVVEADHALAADRARQDAYAAGLEHVHVKSVEVVS